MGRCPGRGQHRPPTYDPYREVSTVTIEERVARLEALYDVSDHLDSIEQRVILLDQRTNAVEQELVGLRADLRGAFERIFASLDQLNRKPGFHWPWEPQP